MSTAVDVTAGWGLVQYLTAAVVVMAAAIGWLARYLIKSWERREDRHLEQLEKIALGLEAVSYRIQRLSRED